MVRVMQSQCWSVCKADAIEHVHTKFCKSLLCVKNQFEMYCLRRSIKHIFKSLSAIKFGFTLQEADIRNYVNVLNLKTHVFRYRLIFKQNI